MTNRRSINIATASSGDGLKSDLQQEAARRGMSRAKLIAGVFAYAVHNRSEFSQPLAKARPKPGQHISTSVPPSLADELNEWAIQRETNRSLLCCYVLEKALEDGMLQKIFSQSYSR